MKKLAVFICLGLSLSLTAGCSKIERDLKTPSVTKTEFNVAKTYDSDQTYPSGSIVVSGVVISNGIFDGDLIIEPTVGDGDVTLSGVQIRGNLLVKGGGEHSIHLDDCKINEIESDRAEGKVRIVVSENTTVENVKIGSATNLEVDGTISSLNVSDKAKGSDISILPLAKVGSVEILAQSTLSIQSAITTLNLKAESTVNIEAPIKNVNIESNAKNTVMTLSSSGVITSLATEAKVEITGEGKISNLITNDKNNLTGNLQPQTTTVSKNPIQETTTKPEITETPVVATATPTNKPVVTTKPVITADPVFTPPVEIPVEKPTPIPTATPNITIVKTKAELQQALIDKKPEIIVQGTLGFENDYTIYRVEYKTSIRGDANSKVYGSFIVDADDVSIQGLEIHNEGWTSGVTDARRNAITVISNRVTLVNNKLVSSTTESATTKISNGISLTANSDVNTNLNIKDNEIIGFGYDNPAWSSTGIIISAGIQFPYNATNTKNQSSSVNLDIDFSKIAHQNKITRCYNDFIYSDYSNHVGFYTQQYSYVSNVTSLISALVYSHPDKSIVELAPLTYSINKVAAEAETAGINGLVVKANTECLIPSLTTINLDSDVEFLVEAKGKLLNGGEINGILEDKNILPRITNATLSYNEASEDLTLDFDLDKGFTLKMYEGFDSIEQIILAYHDFVRNNTVDLAKKLNNDIIYTYYTKNHEGQVEFLKTKSGADLVKNKAWGGYLAYIEDTKAIYLEPSKIPGLEATSLGLTVPHNKHYRNCTNPFTETVISGWLDQAKGKEVYVDIIIIYNGNIIKETVSTLLPFSVVTEDVIILTESEKASLVEDLSDTPAVQDDEVFEELIETPTFKLTEDKKGEVESKTSPDTIEKVENEAVAK